MKKLIYVSLLLVAISFAVAPVNALAFLQNWYLDVDGAGSTYSPKKISEYLNISGTAFIMNDFTTPVPTFNEWGTFQSITSNSGNYGDVTNGYKELTAQFTASGFLLGATSFQFTGGSFDIYVQPLFTYGSAAGIYGSDVGTKIGSFTLLAGGGDLQDNYLPLENGQITAILAATYLAQGYWYSPDMVDMYNWVGNSPTLVMGFSTTNARTISDIKEGDLIATEYDQFPTLTMPDAPGSPGNYGQAPSYFFVGNGGQFSLAVVPEPTSMLLLGMGILGLVPVVRRKKVA